MLLLARPPNPFDLLFEGVPVDDVDPADPVDPVEVVEAVRAKGARGALAAGAEASGEAAVDEEEVTDPGMAGGALVVLGFAGGGGFADVDDEEVIGEAAEGTAAVVSPAKGPILMARLT